MNSLDFYSFFIHLRTQIWGVSLHQPFTHVSCCVPPEYNYFSLNTSTSPEWSTLFNYPSAHVLVVRPVTQLFLFHQKETQGALLAGSYKYVFSCAKISYVTLSVSRIDSVPSLWCKRVAQLINRGCVWGLPHRQTGCSSPALQGAAERDVCKSKALRVQHLWCSQHDNLVLLFVVRICAHLHAPFSIFCETIQTTNTGSCGLVNAIFAAVETN